MTAESANHALDQLANLRDLGGLPTEKGGRTRFGVLWRSAAPRAGDREPGLAGWPPGTVLDLRGTDELGGECHPLANQAAAVHAVALLDKPVYGRGTQYIPDLATAYLRFLSKGGSVLATVAKFVAEASAPVLVHCAAGKDRTGVVIAVLLRAVGVTREAVREDYRRTEAELPAIIARLPELTSLADPTQVQRLMGAPGEAVDAVLDELDATPGGAAGWLREHGVSDNAMNGLRRRLAPHASVATRASPSAAG